MILFLVIGTLTAVLLLYWYVKRDIARRLTISSSKNWKYVPHLILLTGYYFQTTK